MANKPKIEIAPLHAWLQARYADAVTDLAPIGGGFWSAAFTYRVAGADYVVRFSDMAEGFAIDQLAMQFRSDALPIPIVYEVGEALGHHFAISQRHFGRFLENVSPDHAAAVGPAFDRLLAGLRAVPGSAEMPVNWYAEQPDPTATWHAWLRSGLVDHPDSMTHGWREKLAQDKQLDALFQACVDRIDTLLPACPERRDLVHGDLLHQNVLISEDATAVTALFSWKCSVRGDFLFDVAWCSLWSPWHDGIAAIDPWARSLRASDLQPDDLLDAPLRHHCYELQIAASHFGWNVWTGNEADLAATAARAEAILQRGPRLVSETA